MKRIVNASLLVAGLIACFCALPLLAASAEGELPDHELYYTWDGDDWSLNSRTTFGWDGQGRPTTELDEDWQGSAYVNDHLSTTSYDGTGATETITRDWEGDAWVNETRSTFENDGEQRPVVIVTQEWDGAMWENQSRSTITYESGLAMAEMIVETWTEGAWVESFKSVYTYDGGNQAEWISYSKDGDDWVPVFRSTSTYSGGKLETTLTELNFATPPDPPDWTFSSRITNSYEGDNLVEVLFESYDAYAPPIGWNTTGRNTLEYDGQDRLTVEVYESYFETALGWLNSSKTEYFYEAAAVRELAGYTLPEHFSLEQNYPNPFNPSTQIRFAVTTPGQVRLDIFDITGRKVTTLVDQSLPVGTHQAGFDAVGLASGVYFYRLQIGGFEQTRKMLLVK